MRTLLVALALVVIALPSPTGEPPEMSRAEKIAALDKAVISAEKQLAQMAEADKIDRAKVFAGGKAEYTSDVRKRRDKKIAELTAQLADLKAKRAALDTPAEKLAAAEAAVKAAEAELASAKAKLGKAQKGLEEARAALAAENQKSE